MDFILLTRVDSKLQSVIIASKQSIYAVVALSSKVQQTEELLTSKEMKNAEKLDRDMPRMHLQETGQITADLDLDLAEDVVISVEETTSSIAW